MPGLGLGLSPCLKGKRKGFPATLTDGTEIWQFVANNRSSQAWQHALTSTAFAGSEDVDWYEPYEIEAITPTLPINNPAPSLGGNTQYVYLRHGQYKYLRGTSNGLRSRVGLIGGYIVYERETASNVWEWVSEEIPLVTGGRCRLGVRGGNWVVDYEINATGFAGAEDTDWKNTSEIANYFVSNYVDSITVTTISDTEQVILADITGGGYTGVSFEYSTDGINFTEHGTSTNATYIASSLTSETIYYWRARLIKGGGYGAYADVVSLVTLNTNLLAGYKLESIDQSDFFNSGIADFGILDVVNKHAAIYYNGKTYIGYAGNDTDPYIITYTHSTSTWATPVKVGTNPLPNTDGHGAPSLLIDSDGYIHCMWGSHVSNILYSKSTNPEDISAWTSMGVPASGSYPQLMQMSDDTIYLFYRQSSDPNTIWGYLTSTNGGTSWSAFTQVTAIGFAYCVFKKGIGDTIHCTISKGTSDANRTNVYYIKFNDTNWVNIAGDVLALTIETTDDILAHDSGAEWNPANAYGFDASNNVYILFTEGHTADPVGGGAGTFFYKFTKYTGGSWITYNIGRSSDNWRDQSTAIDVISSSVIDVYITCGGTASGIGGNVEKWSSVDGGVTWNFSELIKRGQFIDPAIVQNHHADARVLFIEYRGIFTTWTRRGYLWGDSGFVKNSSVAITQDINGAFDAIAENTPSVVAGKYGNAYSFASASSENVYYNDDNKFSFTDGTPDHPFSISFWLNIPATNVTAILLGKIASVQGEWFILLLNGVIYFRLQDLAGDNLITATAPFTTTNTWVFFTFTYDGAGLETGLKIYINKVESQTAQTETGTYIGMANGTGRFTIARRDLAATPYYLNGILDEVKLWNKELTQTEINLIEANTTGW